MSNPNRCFDVAYSAHAEKMCRHCPRRITLTPADKRPNGWREEALNELHPLHVCSFILRDPARTPLTLVEQSENDRAYAQVKREFYGASK